MASLADGIARAILTLLETEKTVAEGAGAVAPAAILEGKVKLAGKQVAAIVSGGNIDVNKRRGLSSTDWSRMDGAFASECRCPTSRVA